MWKELTCETDVLRLHWLVVRQSVVITLYIYRTWKLWGWSIMDYCNSLLHDITAEQLGRLQKIQNTAARLILRGNRRSSATMMLHELHWLPIKKRVMYKLFLMVYKSQHDMVPDYITAHLLDYTPSRLLRSSEDRQLVVIKMQTHYGDISFQVAAAKLWNVAHFQLKRMQNIDSFKSKLKTYLFMLNL